MSRRIEERRKELGYTQAEICRIVKICPKSYVNYAKLGHPIPSHKLEKMADVLKCTTDHLLGRSLVSPTTPIADIRFTQEEFESLLDALIKSNDGVLYRKVYEVYKTVYKRKSY